MIYKILLKYVPEKNAFFFIKKFQNNFCYCVFALILKNLIIKSVYKK